MIFPEKPENFQPDFEVAICYIESDDDLLFILRQPWEGEGNKWCMPGGMIDKGETPEQAVIREAREETGLMLDPGKLTFFSKIYVKKFDYSYILHKFHQRFDIRPNVIVNYDEHADFKWIKPEDGADTLDLLTDGAQDLEMFLQWRKKTS